MKANDLKDILHYNLDTGVFKWRVDIANVKAGTVAGTLHHEGYIQIKYNGGFYGAHRLAFLYVTGSFPVLVDHKDRDRANNAWSNLRSASHQQNVCNASIRSDNPSGTKGIRLRPSGKWQARVALNGKEYTKTYIERSDAEAWLINKRNDLHKDFSCHT